MISDEELEKCDRITMRAIEDIDAHGFTHYETISQYRVLQLIAEIRRLREQLKPDCVNGCIFKLARKIAEDGE